MVICGEKSKIDIKPFLAFTLAEVIIVLGIVGIISQMVIPPLIENAQKREYVASLKKVASELDEMLLNLTVDYGCTGNLKATSLFDVGDTNAALGAAIAPYFKITKNCGAGASATGCWSNSTHQYFDGADTAGTDFDASTGYKFITTDGMSWVFSNDSGGCTTTSWGTSYLSQVCGYVYVDVNGLKKPNSYGRDIFGFYLSNGKGAQAVAYGTINSNNGTDWWNNGSANRCSSSSTGTDRQGKYCTGRIIEKGWVMDY